MTITNYQVTQTGGITTVTVTSDLAGDIWFAWYVDGAWVATTRARVRSFRLPPGDRARVDVQDTNDAAYDPIANAPEGFPARRTLWWCRSLAVDVAKYRIDVSVDGGAYAVADYVLADDRWEYFYTTNRLIDLATYTWRIVPVDTLGNDGTYATEGPVQIVRTPDAPAYAIAFDEGTTKVTISEGTV